MEQMDPERVKRMAIAEMKLVEIQVIQMESAMEIQMALPMGLQEPEMVVLHLVPEALTAVTIPKPAIHQVWHLMEL